MPRRSVKVTTGKTAAVLSSEAMPQQAPKKLRKENLNAPEKGRVATSRTTESSHARRKRVVVVITFINYITPSILTDYSSFSV